MDIGQRGSTWTTDKEEGVSLNNGQGVGVQLGQGSRGTEVDLDNGQGRKGSTGQWTRGPRVNLDNGQGGGGESGVNLDNGQRRSSQPDTPMIFQMVRQKTFGMQAA